MVKAVGYKQIVKHINEFPSALPTIREVSCIGDTRYNPDLPPTNNIAEFAKRPIRHAFAVYLKNTTPSLLPTHYYIFDNMKDAKAAHAQCMKQWIDTQLEPFRQKVKKGRSLTLKQIEYCKKIQDLLPED